LRRGDAWVRDDIAGATEYVRVWEIDGRRLIDLPSLTPTVDQPIALLIGGCHLPPRVFQKISDCFLHHGQYGMNGTRKLSVRSLSHADTYYWSQRSSRNGCSGFRQAATIGWQTKANIHQRMTNTKTESGGNSP
jgi:hypothetical protein